MGIFELTVEDLFGDENNIIKRMTIELSKFRGEYLNELIESIKALKLSNTERDIEKVVGIISYVQECFQAIKELYDKLRKKEKISQTTVFDVELDQFVDHLENTKKSVDSSFGTIKGIINNFREKRSEAKRKRQKLNSMVTWIQNGVFYKLGTHHQFIDYNFIPSLTKMITSPNTAWIFI